MGNTNFFLFTLFLLVFFFEIRSQAVAPLCQMESHFLPKSRINFGKNAMFCFSISDHCKMFWRFSSGGVFSRIFPWLHWVDFSIQFHRKKVDFGKKQDWSQEQHLAEIGDLLPWDGPGGGPVPGEQQGPQAPQGHLGPREATVAVCWFPSILVMCILGCACLKFFEAAWFLQQAFCGLGWDL